MFAKLLNKKLQSSYFEPCNLYLHKIMDSPSFASRALQCSLSLFFIARLCSICICLILNYSCSIVSSRIAISSRKSSFLRSNDFILPLPKRELTLLARAVAASVATLLSLSVRISDFTCVIFALQELSAIPYAVIQSLCVQIRLAASR